MTTKKETSPLCKEKFHYLCGRLFAQICVCKCHHTELHQAAETMCLLVGPRAANEFLESQMNQAVKE